MILEIKKIENFNNFFPLDRKFKYYKCFFNNKAFVNTDILNKNKYLYFIMGACYNIEGITYNFEIKGDKYNILIETLCCLFKKIVVSRYDDCYLLSITGLSECGYNLLFNIDDLELKYAIDRLYLSKNKGINLDEGIYEIVASNYKSNKNYFYLLELDVIDITNITNLDDDIINYLLTKDKKLYINSYSVKGFNVKNLYIRS